MEETTALAEGRGEADRKRSVGARVAGEEIVVDI
jgi:hypothetical protein